MTPSPRMRVALTALALLIASATGAAPAHAAVPPAPAVTAEGWVVYDPHDEVVLAGHEADAARRMASTTKIMTALLAIEAGALGNSVTVSAAAATADDVPGAATLGLVAGQQLPMRALLPALLLRSGNDAAAAVAEHVAGSRTAFVALMNARAAELGLTQTHFVDASGLTDDPTHRASPRDLAALAVVAMQHPEFAEWVDSATLSVPPFGALDNRNELVGTYAGATGVKTGFTTLAGLCLVASATRDGRDLYVTVLDSAVDPARRQHFVDSAALLDYGFAGWRRAQPVPNGARATRYRWADAAVPLLPADHLARTVPSDASVTWRTALDLGVARSVAPGSAVGTLELLVDGRVVESTPLVTATAVSSRQPQAPAAAAGAAVQDALRDFVRTVPFERTA